jgi:putative ABC transport system permease protein
MEYAAHGAHSSDILRPIVVWVLKLVMTGITIGLVSTLAVTRLMASLLYDVSATDPITFLAIAVLLMVVALAACWIPARTATKVDPMIALSIEAFPDQIR